MDRPVIRFAVFALLFGFGACKRGAAPPSAQDIARLTQAASESLTISYSPVSQRPSFVRGRIPLPRLGVQPGDTSAAKVVSALMAQYARLFGVDSGARDLQLVESRADRLGMRHVVMQQKVDNVPVYNAIYAVHVDPRSNSVAALTSSLVPDIQVNTTTPKISADSARAVARAYLIRGQAGVPRLMVYQLRDQRSRARLAWIVEVSGFALRDTTAAASADTIPARRDVVVDATAAKPLDIIDRLYVARNRRIHDAAGTTTLPGTLARSEGQGPVADPDVNSAYQFLGSTYDYYSTTHGRDSYDNAGATLLATVNYDVNFQNAFWNGTQMVFGDGFAVEDVTAHELTHAVTERTANLEYVWQSGALNESFSDIFGAMVDRADWLMGEDLPIGAIRDLQNPGAFGQPDNMSGWVATCSDNQGVHTNSGIFNKAFVNVATAIGKNDAERIFYRTLTTPGYLSPQATMEDARGAAIQSAVDLFGSGSSQVNATTSGFAAVGLDGVRQPPANSCQTFPQPSALSTAALLIVLAVLLLLVARARIAARA
jgi:Zn-dependent metalloprotease